MRIIFAIIAGAALAVATNQFAYSVVLIATLASIENILIYVKEQ